MKKVFAFIAMAIASMGIANAQIGVVGGVTFTGTDVNTKDLWANAQNITQYHVGVAYRVDLGILAFQPTLTYEVKGASLDQTVANIQVGGQNLQQATQDFETKTGFIELGLGVQAGVDLMMFKPFVEVSPFIGYGITGQENYNITAAGIANGTTTNEDVNAALTDVKNKLEVGFGLGAGVLVMDHIQLKVQYFMNLGKLYDEGKIDANDKLTTIKESYKDIKNYNGIKISLGLFF